MKSTQEKIKEAAVNYYIKLPSVDDKPSEHSLILAYEQGANFALSLDRWVAVEEALPEKSPVLVAFLEQRFGQFGYEIGVGYYDSPSHYENPEEGTGWRFWIPDRKIVGKGVTHWQPLPTPPNTKER